jgi:hypothetical protein
MIDFKMKKSILHLHPVTSACNLVKKNKKVKRAYFKIILQISVMFFGADVPGELALISSSFKIYYFFIAI